MKKTESNPVDLFCIGLKGITLTANMLVLTALCCTDDKECDGFEELTAISHYFDTVLHKALEDKKLSSSAVVSTAKRYFSVLKEFKNLLLLRLMRSRNLLQIRKKLFNQ